MKGSVECMIDHMAPVQIRTKTSTNKNVEWLENSSYLLVLLHFGAKPELGDKTHKVCV